MTIFLGHELIWHWWGAKMAINISVINKRFIISNLGKTIKKIFVVYNRSSAIERKEKKTNATYSNMTDKKIYITKFINLFM